MKTAWAWDRLRRYAWGSMGIVLVPTLGFFVGSRDPWLILMIGTYCGWVLLGAPTLFVAWLKGLDAQKRELSDGFTTMQGVFQNAEQRDSTTGVVLRAAGRPFLTGQEFRTARLNALEHHHD